MSPKKNAKYIPPVGPGSKSVPQVEIQRETGPVAPEVYPDIPEAVTREVGRTAAAEPRPYIPPVGPGSKSVAH